MYRFLMQRAEQFIIMRRKPVDVSATMMLIVMVVIIIMIAVGNLIYIIA